MVMLSGNPMVLRAYTSKPLTTENLRVKLTVSVETVPDSGTYDETVTIETSPDAAGKVTFDISTILKAYLEQPSFPSYNLSSIQPATNNMRRYQMLLSESYGDPPTDHYYLFSTSIWYAYTGALNFEEVGPVNYLATTLVGTKNYLSWQPTTIHTTEAQHQYLYYYHSRAGKPTLTVHADVYYTDGSSDMDQAVKSMSTAAIYGVYIIPAGFTQLDIASINPLKTVDYYVLRLKATPTSVQVGKDITYYIDRKYRRTTRYFLYVNSLGGVDSIRAQGRASYELAVDKTTISIYDPANHSVVKGQRRSFGHTGTLRKSVSLGHLTIEEISRLSELLLSKKVVEVVNDRYLPLDTTKSTFKLLDEGTRLQHLVLDYQYMYDYNAYTPQGASIQAVQGDFNDDFNDDFQIQIP